MSSSEISLRWAAGPKDLEGAIGLRKLVFCQEQGVPVEDELDGRDDEALHLLALERGRGHVVGTLRLLFDGEVVKVGRVAVAACWRRRGIAARMLAIALARARQRGSRTARLAAQLDAVELYEKAGFAVESDVFQEAGIDHVWMGRRLEWRLIVFDCDGVLVDSERISNDVLALMLSEQGLPTTLAQARADYQGLLLGDIAVKAEGKLGHSLPEDWLSDYERRRADAFDAGLQVVAGAQELVEEALARGVAICVASQGSLSKTERSLALTGLDRLFPPHTRFSAHDRERGKPHPDLFLHAAGALGIDPGDCVVIEDSPSGVTAAVRAGMAVFGYAADSDADALRLAGARTYCSHRDLSALLWPAAPSSLRED